ncbi:hypothetical protein ABIF68_001631 [Bradyrhizobium japonicum]
MRTKTSTMGASTMFDWQVANITSEPIRILHLRSSKDRTTP